MNILKFLMIVSMVSFWLSTEFSYDRQQSSYTMSSIEEVCFLFFPINDREHSEIFWIKNIS